MDGYLWQSTMLNSIRMARQSCMVILHFAWEHSRSKISDISPWYLVTMILLRGIQNVPGIQVVWLMWIIMDDFQTNKKKVNLSPIWSYTIGIFFKGFNLSKIKGNLNGNLTYLWNVPYHQISGVDTLNGMLCPSCFDLWSSWLCI